MQLDHAAPHRLAPQACHHEAPAWRPHLVEDERQRRLGVVAGVEAVVELGEVAAEAVLRVVLARVHHRQAHQRGGEQGLDLGHRPDQAALLGRAERCHQLAGEGVAALVEQGALVGAGGRQARRAHPPVTGGGRHGHQSRPLEGPQQAAEVARVQVEATAQVAHLGAVGPDLPQHPRLAERSGPGQVVLVEGADALGDEAVEPTHLVDRSIVQHLLTLVRFCGGCVGRCQPRSWCSKTPSAARYPTARAKAATASSPPTAVRGARTVQ